MNLGAVKTFGRVGLTMAASAGVALAQSGEVATKTYDSGAVYEGQFKDGRQHGRGGQHPASQ